MRARADDLAKWRQGLCQRVAARCRVQNRGAAGCAGSSHRRDPDRGFEQNQPFEAGIGFSVALKTKEDDFIGRDALVRRKEHPSRKLVGLEIDRSLAISARSWCPSTPSTSNTWR